MAGSAADLMLLMQHADSTYRSASQISKTTCHLDTHLYFLRAAASSSRAFATRPLTHAFVARFTITRRPSPRTSTYTSTMLRAVRAASAAFSPAVGPYLCATAAVTAAPPASTSRTEEAESEARMSAAESAKRVRAVGGAGAGDWTRELEGEGRVEDLL